MYRYETHLHTSPVSKCARSGVRDTLEFYKEEGYDGVFITNHFLDGNIDIDRNLPYREKLDFYLSDYNEGCRVGRDIGLKVFFGVELSYNGTDFMIYDLEPEWYYTHEEIMRMSKKTELAYLREAGAFIIQAHPFREKNYIDHIRLYPRSVDGVEVLNGTNRDDENDRAEYYAEHYGLLKTAGTDNHIGRKNERLTGVMSETPFTCEADYGKMLKAGALKTFSQNCYDTSRGPYPDHNRDIRVLLKGNPTTGYQWTAHAEGDLPLKGLDSPEYISGGKKGMAGCGGIYDFRIRAEKPEDGMTAAVHFSYSRSWEPGEADGLELKLFAEDGKLKIDKG